MFSIASSRRLGRAGEKADWLRFSQPRGAVMTTSSNEREEPQSVLIVTVALSWWVSDWMEVTFVESRILAFVNADLATLSSIFS